MTCNQLRFSQKYMSLTPLISLTPVTHVHLTLKKYPKLLLELSAQDSGLSGCISTTLRVTSWQNCHFTAGSASVSNMGTKMLTWSLQVRNNWICQSYISLKDSRHLMVSRGLLFHFFKKCSSSRNRPISARKKLRCQNGSFLSSKWSMSYKCIEKCSLNI